MMSPIYVECDKMCGSKVWVQEFWYFVSGLDIQSELSKINNPARKKAIAGCETLQVIRWVIYCFSLRASGCRQTQTNGWVVKASHRKFGDFGFDSSMVLKLSAAPRPFCVAQSPSRQWHTRFLYCCALYNFSSSWISSVAILCLVRVAKPSLYPLTCTTCKNVRQNLIPQATAYWPVFVHKL